MDMHTLLMTVTSAVGKPEGASVWFGVLDVSGLHLLVSFFPGVPRIVHCIQLT